MLYDIHDHDDGADLLISTASLPMTAASPAASHSLNHSVSAPPVLWPEGTHFAGAAAPGTPPGTHHLHFRNGYGAVVQQRGSEFSVSLQGDWLSGQDREEVFGLSQSEVTTFLHSVEALSAPDVTDLGEF